MNMDDDGNVNYECIGSNDDGEPNIDTQNGFIKNTNAGLQYSNKWNDKQTLNLSPKYNNQIYTNKKSVFNKTQIGQTQLNEKSESTTDITRSNFKLNTTYDVKIDSVNTLKISTKTNFYNTASNEFTGGNTTDENGILKNKRQINLDSKTDKNSVLASILFKHKFAKARRTFSVNTSWSRLNNNITNFLNSENDSYTLGILSSITLLNQNKTAERTTQSTNLNIAYTEPLGKKFALQLAYQIDYNTGKNNQLTYDLNPVSGKYDLLVNDISNRFKQTIAINKPNVKISYNSKKINFGFGSGFGFTSFDLLDETMNKQYNRNFTNLFPTANFSYKYKSNSTISFRYNGATKQPTLEQLQPLRNNQDFFNQIIGNPNLKQSFTNNFNVNFNSYSLLTESHMYSGFNIRNTSNLISYNKDIDPNNAKTTTKPINTNGNFSGNFYMGYGFKIKKIDADLNLNPSFSFNKSVISINNIENTSNNLNSRFSVYLSKSVEKKYDITISNTFANNRNRTTQNNQTKSFNSNDLSLDMGVFFREKWKLSSDYNVNTRGKTDDFQSNLSNQIWNARLQRTFKNDEFTAYILVRDILNQNIGIQRYNFENTVGEELNDRLQRYAMVGFTWNFKNKGENKQQTSN